MQCLQWFEERGAIYKTNVLFYIGVKVGGCMRALLIAEKPSLMRDIEKVYKKMSLDVEIDFASFVGHVVELKEPHEYNEQWKKWSLELLPMMPTKYEFRPKKSAFQVQKDLKDKLRHGNYDFLINACDAGMEGENIFYSFYKYAKLNLPVKRFWTSQTTDPAIRAALENLIDENDPLIRNLRNAAMYRMIFDWLIGLNLTRAATVKGGRTIKVGRVMTPTLAIVVNRELEILNFEPKPYHQIELDVGEFKALWTDVVAKRNRVDTRAEAEQIVSECTRNVIVEKIEKERKTIYAPSLHSLLELQKEANKFYGMTSAQTLKVAQSLYEKKLITYPRTESKHLPTNFAKTIRRNVEALKGFDKLSGFVEGVLAREEAFSKLPFNKKYVDDKKLTDHHAITVTDVAIGRKSLTPDELKIYELVAKRLLAIFMPPYVIDKTATYLRSGKHLFVAKGEMVIDAGFTALYPRSKKESFLPVMTEGQSLSAVGIAILDKMTEPPPRYTDSTLLDAMFHAGRFVDDPALKEILKDAEGIGTSATRAEIIEKLLSSGMMEREGKSFKATKFGMEVIAALRGHDVVSPVLTAIWSKKLKDIVDGTLESRQFYMELIQYVKQTTEQMKQLEMEVAQKEKVVVGRCVECGSPVIEGFKGYSCESKACQFFFSNRMLGAKITVNDMRNLLNGKQTREIMFKWKSGKKSKARLKLVGGKPEFIFPAFVKK